MLDVFIALMILGFINPSDPTGKTMYPSGIKEADTYLDPRLPKTPRPLLVLGREIYDENGEIIPRGRYELALSEDKAFMYLIQIDKILGKFPVLQIKQHIDKKYSVPVAETEIFNHSNMLIIYKHDNIEAHGVTYLRDKL